MSKKSIVGLESYAVLAEPGSVVERSTPLAATLTAHLNSLPDGGDALRELIAEGSSANTRASYKAAYAYWHAWHLARIGTPFSVPLADPVPTVLLFLADHLAQQDGKGTLPDDIDEALVKAKVKAKLGPYALATVRHRLAVLSEAHEALKVDNPCRHRSVVTVLDKTKKAFARRGVKVAKKDALTREPLEQLLATCGEDLIGVRDRAMLMFAFASGGRRRSEVVRATMDNLKRVSDGFVYTLSHSKTNQAGADRADSAKPVLGSAAEAMDAWLALSKVTEGPIFRRIIKGGGIGGGLHPEALRVIVKARAKLAGLGDNFAAHSLRSGFVTEAGEQQMPLAEVMALSGHAAVTSVIGYHRAGEVVKSKAGRLLDNEKS
ncbi:tyrosine-type recombinase/integrase [Achromobacter anxifer]|uniref:tyrosine-type recombinase/integrase n=1 Tax=Achromobacter anxifer TaxID=1287737 RepID=UPI0023F7303E|nr:tyrosine-type recombinase/integrase [Achromobacter anxifer]MDF8364725.1 tyrosine-type recombinase/integrase [Achromobacter anxifer]